MSCQVVPSSEWRRTHFTDQLWASAKLECMWWGLRSYYAFKPKCPQIHPVFNIFLQRISELHLCRPGNAPSYLWQSRTMYPKTGKGLSCRLVRSFHLISENIKTHGGKVTFIKWLITICYRPGSKRGTFIISWKWYKTKIATEDLL